MNGLLGQRPAVNGLLDIPVTANRNMLAQAMKAKNKPEFQMKENTLQGILDGAAMATSPVPILGDLFGLGADGYRFATDPSSRNMLNYGLAALGALPMVPAMSIGLGKLAKSQGKTLGQLPTGPGRNQAGAIVYHGTDSEPFESFDRAKFGSRDHGTVGVGVYGSPDRSLASGYGKNVLKIESTPDNAIGFDDAMKIKSEMIDEARKSGVSEDYLGKNIGKMLTERLTGLGYDGVSPSPNYWGQVGNSWTFFNPEKVKVLGVE